MKIKLLFLLLIPLVVSGCVSSETIKKEDAETIKEPVVKTVKDLPEAINQPKDKLIMEIVKDVKKIEPTEFDDLVSKYKQAIIKTSLGDIKVELYNNDSPITVNNFLNLANKEFYDNTKFHRVIKNFMIQAGDPNSKDNNWDDDGTGGPGYSFKDEINEHKLVKGSLAMANSGPNTNGSQFFIVTANQTSWLDGLHTNFGYVIDGLDVIEKIEKTEANARDHPINDIIIKSIVLE